MPTRSIVTTVVIALAPALAGAPVARAGTTCTPGPDGLIAWWPGEGNADDLAYGRDGTLVGGATFATGQVGQAFSLDGTDDYVTVPDAEVFDPPTGAISVEAWVRADSLGTEGGAVVTKYDSSANARAWVLSVQADGSLRWAIYNDLTDKSRVVDTVAGSITTGAWYHVAGTFDVATQEMKTYIDGAEVSNTFVLSDTISSLADTGSDVRIGAFIGAGGTPKSLFDGLIDEPAVYNRAVSAAEMQAIYDAGSAGKCLPDRVHNVTQDTWYYSITAAVDAAVNFDVLEAQPDNYYEQVDFGGKHLTLRSTDPTDPAVVAATVINASGLPGRAVVCVDCAEVSGLTVRGGEGGMEVALGAPTISHCVFTDNDAVGGAGGGMYILAGSSPTVTHCTFTNNSASLGGGVTHTGSGTATITNCVFSGNEALGDGGAIYNTATADVTNCTFTGNSADSDGGGMYNDVSSAATVTNCTFSGNTAGSGGGMYNDNSDPTVTNCTFTGNTADFDGGGMYNSDSSPTVTNCILWGDGPDEIFNFSSSSNPTIAYSNVQGSGGSGAGWDTSLGVDSGGNIDADPLFVDTEGGDLRLGPCSPAIDAGDNGAVPGGVTTDLDGNPRFVDDTNVPDSGNGTPPIVDMGAYENQPPFGGTVENVTQGTVHCLIQDAIDAASGGTVAAGAGDEIVVAPGTYVESIDFLGKAITVRSTDPTDPAMVAATIIDATGLGGSVVTCVSGEGPETLLSGFTITGGSTNQGGGMRVASSSPTVTRCTFTGNTADFGGGMSNRSDSNPTVAHCTFSNNNAGNGGGISNRSNSNPTIIDCTFGENTAGADGGGMHNGNSSPTVTNCTFSGNTADLGGGMYSGSGSASTVTNCLFTENTARAGGGMFSSSGSSLTVSNCAFTGNSATEFGGGMYNSGSSPTVTNCTFSGNTANHGGGMANDFNNPTVTNCTFSGNSAGFNGGGMWNRGDSPTVTNCTFSGNTAGSGGGMYNGGSNPTVTNSILWGDSPDEIFNDSATPTIAYSDVQRGLPAGSIDGGGNIDADPLFVDPDGVDNTVGTPDDDLRLMPGSPCIDAGDNDALPAGVTTDLDGNPRFVDNPAIPDTGNGTGPLVDIGAYELQSDCTGDGLLDVNAPGSIAGTYNAPWALFGPPPTIAGTTGDVALAAPADACSPITNPATVSGKVALVDRGACFFTTKVKNCQDAGAIAVIVANNVADPPFRMGAGTNDLITIPSVMVSQSDGDTIRSAVSGGDTVNVRLYAPEATGSCCDPVAGVCTENLFAESCTAAGEFFTCNRPCCEVECRDPAGPEFAASGVKLLSNVPLTEFAGPPPRANEVWGYVSPSGREYALIGLECAVAVIEITDPLNPVVIGEVPGSCSTWRDMAVFGEHAYAVADEVTDGLYVIDLSAVDSGSITFTTTGAGIGFTDAHNVYVNQASGYLYLAIPNTNDALGLTVLDLNVDPADPTLAGFWTDPAPDVRCHDVQVVTYTAGKYAGREIAFCFAENDGLLIADVTDKNDMFTVSGLVYPNTTYAHQGWLSHDNRYVFLGDELDERDDPDVEFTTTYVIDVSDLNNPSFVTAFDSGLCTIDHNLMARGNRLYEANYATGLRVFDVADVNNIQEVGYFDTRPENNFLAFDGAWGVFTMLPSRLVLVSDRQRGLFVLDVSQVDAMKCGDGILDPGEECEPPGSAGQCPDDGLCAADCTCPLAPPPVQTCSNDFAAESGGTDGERLNRFGCFAAQPPAAAGTAPTAMRIVLHTLYNISAGNPDGASTCPPNRTRAALDPFTDQVRYLGQPVEYVDESSPQNPNYIAAPLVCDPQNAAVRDWSPEGLLAEFGTDADTTRVYFFGPPVVPCSIYAVEHCTDPASTATCSEPTLVHTALLADVWSPFALVNVTDITKLVDKFRGVAYVPGPPPGGAPAEPRALLRDNVAAAVGKLLNVTDITNGIDGFRGLPYKEQGPCDPGGTDDCGNPCDPTPGD